MASAALGDARCSLANRPPNPGHLDIDVNVETDARFARCYSLLLPARLWDVTRRKRGSEPVPRVLTIGTPPEEMVRELDDIKR